MAAPPAAVLPAVLRAATLHPGGARATQAALPPMLSDPWPHAAAAAAAACCPATAAESGCHHPPLQPPTVALCHRAGVLRAAHRRGRIGPTHVLSVVTLPSAATCCTCSHAMRSHVVTLTGWVLYLQCIQAGCWGPFAGGRLAPFAVMSIGGTRATKPGAGMSGWQCAHAPPLH